MQEFVGRLTALDPRASETLKVITYFDTLLANEVGTVALIRGAAVLTGVPAGAELDSRIIRVDPKGDLLPSRPYLDPWPMRDVQHGRRAWIEREGPPHANDAMVLERLSLTIGATFARGMPIEPNAVEALLDGDRALNERNAIAVRLRLDANQHLYAIASAVSNPMPTAGPSTVIATPHGLVRATIATAGNPAPCGPAGIGITVSADALPESWQSAYTALRLTRGRPIVVDAAQLGALLEVANTTDTRRPLHPDAVALSVLDDHTTGILDALVQADSVRAAALALGMHHSTVQARHEALTRELGYNPRSARGRARYEVARMLCDLATPWRL